MTNTYQDWYQEDLAYVHDQGFSDYALSAAPGILEILGQNEINSSDQNLIVELGCGSGILTQALTTSGCQVLGVDISAAMIAIAKARAPQARFILGSMFTVDIPPCAAVVSVGECLNYLFDGANNLPTLANFFQRIYKALQPNGLLIFDIAEPGLDSCDQATQSFVEGKDWLVLVEKSENPRQNTLTRRIITFRQVGEQYRRSDEVHVQQLYQSAEIADLLMEIGFEVKIKRSYGQFHLPDAHAAIVAIKPAKTA
ncbi:Methyltransferase type 11 [Thalassoporum mexicanum PCC 7367]|uniref:class I SAM-dependent methyltransferase n=1 Tax=Thalassoporum mexicanum TaxID=3457544 RepID=UPI00029FDD9F|nr:class I SAM-dependent methyltransferase [Pseudanabaena sp. PCC 7367]AFY69291.1 Methyltransferase type 11 [Pseudanabaena sp. PCC 7367]